MKYILSVALAFAFSAFPDQSWSMEMEYWPASQTGNNVEPARIFIEGGVELDDGDRLQSLLDRHPDVERIIVGQSPGGYLFGGIEVANIIYDNDLDVQINGPAASAATVISLGARQRLYFVSDASGPGLGSQLLFHCAYISADACDERGTRRSAEILEKLTRRSADEWYEVLMSTTPDTVVRISVEEILQYDDWFCSDAGPDGTVCERTLVVDEAQPQGESGIFELGPDQCWLEYVRVPDTQSALSQIQGAGMVGLPNADTTQHVFNTSNGEVVVTFGQIEQADLEAWQTRYRQRSGLEGDLVQCASGADYVSRRTM